MAAGIVLAVAAAAASACAAARPEGRAPPDRLFPIYEGDRVGYIDRAGRMVVLPRYGFSLEADFVEGRARVWNPDSPDPSPAGAGDQRRKHARAGFIDATGRLVIEPIYDDAKLFSEGLAAVGRNGKYGYVDAQGVVRIPLQFDSAGRFSEGLAQVRDAAGVRFIDREGKTAIDMNAVRWAGMKVWPVGSFSDGLVSIAVGEGRSRQGLMDRAGRIVVDPRLVWIYGMHRGYATVQVEGAQGVIDRQGRFVISPSYPMLGLMIDGLVWFAAENGRRGVLNEREEVVIEPVYGYVGDFSEGLCPVSDDERWAYVDDHGRKILELPPGTRFATSFRGGLARAESEKGWTFIRRDGTPAFEGHFDRASDFVDGLAQVMFEGRRPGYVDLQGRVVYRSTKPILLW